MVRFRSHSQLALARVGGWKWRRDCIFDPQLERHETIPGAIRPRSSTSKSKSANHAWADPFINFGAPKFEIKKYVLSQSGQGVGTGGFASALLSIFLAPFRG
jgi:hypothetical protein